MNNNPKNDQLAKKTPIIGIMGGMGPEGTIDLMQKVLKASHSLGLKRPPHLLIDLHPQIPGRVAAAEGRGPSPMPVFHEMIRRLVDGDAELLVMACNAAHFFYESVQAASPVPVMNMIDIVVQEIKNNNITSAIALIGAGRLVERLYYDPLVKAGLHVVTPTDDQRDTVNKCLSSFTEGQLTPQVLTEMNLVLNDFHVNNGCNHLISACTELTVILNSFEQPVLEIIDPIWVIAKHIVAAAYKSQE